MDKNTVYKRAAQFDEELVLKNAMGPNVVSLTDFLTQPIPIKKGMKVLDLGCGKAISSLFLAKETEAQIWAADLWVSPDENWERVLQNGAEERVYPMRVEGHSLPFPKDFFDVIVSVDAYHYFGTDVMYLSYLLSFLKRGGYIGFVSPGVKEELGATPPEEFSKLWDPAFYTFHTCEWWKTHWERTALVDIVVCDEAPFMMDIWRDTEVKAQQYRSDEEKAFFENDLKIIDADNGKYLCFPRVIARKKDS